jgi:hypothetical protein
LGGGGEDHTDLVRDPTSAATVFAAIIVTALATRVMAGRGRSNDAQDSNARQTACANVGGLMSAFV